MIPYFDAMIRFHTAAQSSKRIQHSPIPHIETAILGAKYGYRHCFHVLGTNLAAYQGLFETLEFLGVDQDPCNFYALAEALKKPNSWMTVTRGHTRRRRGAFRFFRPVNGRPAALFCLPDRDLVFDLLGRIITGSFDAEGVPREHVTSIVHFVARRLDYFEPIEGQVLRAAWEWRFQPLRRELDDLDRLMQKSYRAAGLEFRRQKRGAVGTLKVGHEDVLSIHWEWLRGEDAQASLS